MQNHIEKSKILTDKQLHVTEYWNGNRRQSFERGDRILVGNHRILLDKAGKIQRINFKNAKGNAMQADFWQTKNGYNVISFNDGINVMQSGKEVAVACEGIILRYDNRYEFAKSYKGDRGLPQPYNRFGNGR